MQTIRKPYLLVPLLNFLLASLLGLFMRFAYIGSIDIPFQYRYLVHAHSHVAILGWVYLALFGLSIASFLPEWYSKYKLLFWSTQVSVIGMLLSFPFQGYAAVSISFSTLHLILSYFFIYQFWKDTKHLKSLGVKMMHTAMLYMFLSTLGLWGMGPIMAMKLGGSWIQVVIQFFLHFQFNGWFVFAVLALLFHKIKLEPTKNFRRFFVLLNLSLPLTYALPISWYFKSPIWWWCNTIGILLQFLSVYYLLVLLKPKVKQYWQQADVLKRSLILFTGLSFSLKILLQSGSFVPSLAESLSIHVNFVIGFIHLTMLGMITGFLLLFLLEVSNFIGNRLLLNLGVSLFIAGVFFTELLLFIQGLLFYLEQGVFANYHLLLFIASTLLVLGICVIGLQVLFKNKTVRNAIA